MTSKKNQSIGELELEVLKVIWQEEPCSVQAVTALIQKRRKCARTTILTVMQRLFDKGYLKRKKNCNVYEYSSVRGRKKVMSGLIGQFLDKVLDGSPGSFVSYLAESNRLTEKQIAALEDIVEEIEE